jgi:undecaprenyl-diphosphatase
MEIIMDKMIFNFINRLSGRKPFIDIVMVFISKRIRYLYFIVLIFLWFKSYSSKKVAKKAIYSAMITWMIRIVSNIFYFRPRPFVSNRVGILMPSKTDSTFFSKHTLLSFAVSSSILVRYNLLGKVLMGFSVLTGISRIWVGHHYPSDIIRSAFIGGLISQLVEKLYHFRFK